MTDIKIEYTSLAQAVADLRELESQLVYQTCVHKTGRDLITGSSGKTFNAINKTYAQLLLIEEQLSKLITATMQITENIKDSFYEEEKAAADRIYNI